MESSLAECDSIVLEYAIPESIGETVGLDDTELAMFFVELVDGEGETAEMYLRNGEKSVAGMTETEFPAFNLVALEAIIQAFDVTAEDDLPEDFFGDFGGHGSDGGPDGGFDDPNAGGDPNGGFGDPTDGSGEPTDGGDPTGGFGDPNDGGQASNDADFDGIDDDRDAFPQDPLEVADFDEDDIGDNADGCPSVVDDGTDTDQDGIPDACELEDGSGENRDLGLDGTYIFDVTVATAHTSTEVGVCDDEDEAADDPYDLIDPDIKNFSYIATHDLKEPLRTIHSFSQHRLRHSRGGGWLDTEARTADLM